MIGFPSSAVVICAGTSGAVVTSTGVCGVVEQADNPTINPISKKMVSFFMRFLLFL
jgi:hypothetical protein